MTLRQLATFSELARRGSVKAAAEHLFVSQSAVSAVLGALQRELGVDLVAREGRGIRLTPAGEVLADYARRIHGLLGEAAAASASAALPERGTVRLAAVTTAGEHILPGVIASFRIRHPGASVSLEVTNRGRVWERLRAHEVDLVVAGRPPSGAALRTRAIRPHELVLVSAPGLIATIASPADLAGQAWLLREPGSGTRATTEEYLAAQGIAPVFLTLGSNGAVREAAAVGLGLTLISRDAVAAEIGTGRLLVIDAPGVPLLREWHLVTRSHEQLAATAALFVDHLVTGCGFVAVKAGAS